MWDRRREGKGRKEEDMCMVGSVEGREEGKREKEGGYKVGSMGERGGKGRKSVRQGQRIREGGKGKEGRGCKVGSVDERKGRRESIGNWKRV